MTAYSQRLSVRASSACEWWGRQELTHLTEPQTINRQLAKSPNFSPKLYIEPNCSALQAQLSKASTAWGFRLRGYCVDWLPIAILPAVTRTTKAINAFFNGKNRKKSRNSQLLVPVMTSPQAFHRFSTGNLKVFHSLERDCVVLLFFVDYFSVPKSERISTFNVNLWNKNQGETYLFRNYKFLLNSPAGF